MKYKTPTRVLALALGVFTTFAAAPGAAAAEPDRVEFELVSSRPGVGQGEEKLVLEQVPGGQKNPPLASGEQTITGQWTMSTAERESQTLEWALGGQSSSGRLGSVGLTNDMKVEASYSSGFTGSLTHTGTTETTRTTETSATTTYRFVVNGPGTEIRRGYRVYASNVGTEHTVERTECSTDLFGNETCAEPTRFTIFQPTGVRLRVQGTGWSSNDFNGGLTQFEDMPVWLTNDDPGKRGQEICPAGVTLYLDTLANTWRLECAFAGARFRGTFLTSDTQVDERNLDLVKARFTLSGDLNGVVDLSRFMPGEGNGVVPLTLNTGDEPLSTAVGGGTFYVNDWHN